MRTGLVSEIKSALVPGVARIRKIPFGLFQGLRFNINLREQAQVFLGLWERETYPSIRAAAKRTDWVVDVGAGKGELCIFFSQRERVKRIIAVEPHPPVIQELTENLRINAVSRERIELVDKFISMENDDNSIALDQLNLDPNARGFIKIDVDGFEIEVLKSARKTLSTGKVDLLVETHSASLETECVALLEDLGYDCSIIENAWWRVFIPEQRPVEHNRWLFAVGNACAAISLFANSVPA